MSTLKCSFLTNSFLLICNEFQQSYCTYILKPNLFLQINMSDWTQPNKLAQDYIQSGILFYINKILRYEWRGYSHFLPILEILFKVFLLLYTIRNWNLWKNGFIPKYMIMTLRKCYLDPPPAHCNHLVDNMHSK